ncbi:MAG: ABC transporter permease, partial [Lachnospiraceae bacterium]|nr:ABC transporter permease [Lachnospiraceae bacterium]
MFYFKFGFRNIKKNKGIFFPYFLAMIFLVMINLLMRVMANNQTLTFSRGAFTVQRTFGMSIDIIIIFTAIFSIYVNSYILKQRKKEIGLYQILGMNRFAIGKLLLAESLINYIVVMVVGLICGSVFSDLMFLIFRKMIKDGYKLAFQLNLNMIIPVVILMAVVFLIQYIISVFQLVKFSPKEFLNSANSGEAEPKSRFILGFIGVVALGAGYYLALTTENPVKAMSVLFFAIVLVIIGTYGIMIAGSVIYFKLLRKNKGYFYKPNHFISVSSMIYRMKQNGAGLSNITILSSMVLVTISITASLFFGSEQLIDKQSPYKVNITIDDLKETSDEIDNMAKKYDLKYSSVVLNSRPVIFVEKAEDKFKFLDTQYTSSSKSTSFAAFSEKEFERNTGENLKLKDNQVAIYTSGLGYSKNTITIGKETYEVGRRLKGKSYLQKFYDDGIIKYLVVITANDKVKNEIYKDLQSNIKDDGSGGAKQLGVYGIDYSGSKADEKSFVSAVNKMVEKYNSQDDAPSYMRITTREETTDYVHSFTAGFLFLGLVFGLVFTLATALVIYYKQVTEGRDDKRRYQIMQEVGMSRQEVKKTINSQVRSIFAFPIILATLHLVVALPLLKKVLVLFSISNNKLTNMVSAITV